VVHLRGWVPRGDPEGVNTEGLQIRKAGANSFDISLAISIGVSE
jgi:hypothetical protein